jgi:hypothetical protein
VRHVDAVRARIGLVARRHVVRVGGGDEQRVGAADQAMGGQVELVEPPHRCRIGMRRREHRLARLDVARAIAEALLHRDHEAGGVERLDRAVHAVAPPRVRLDAEQAQLGALHQLAGQRIAGHGQRIDAQMRCIGRMREAGRRRQHAGPGLQVRVDAADHEERQLREEGAVLVGHVVADHAWSGHLHLFA